MDNRQSQKLTALEQNKEAWDTVLWLEEQSYMRPGLIECGDFLLSKARK